MTSRSNCAKDNRTLRVKRPIEVVVLNCCVTDTKETPLASKISTILAKSASERVSRSILYTTTTSTLPSRISDRRCCIPGDRDCHPTVHHHHSSAAGTTSPRDADF